MKKDKCNKKERKLKKKYIKVEMMIEFIIFRAAVIAVR
jgi:hypothetical protein